MYYNILYFVEINLMLIHLNAIKNTQIDSYCINSMAYAIIWDIQYSLRSKKIYSL